MKRTTQRDLSQRMTLWEARQFLEGTRRHRAGDKAGAMRKYVKILKRNKRCWPALFSAAVVSHQVCEHGWAVKQLEKIVTHEPHFIEAWYNLGTIRQNVGDYAGAEAALRTALELDPEMVGAYTNLGNALLGLGRPEEAQESFNRALTYKPGDAEAVWNLSHVLILTGQWAKGWECYEYRWQIPGFVEMNAVTISKDREDAPQPWRGAPLEGKTLIVAEEQGWGDTLMCLRFAPALRKMGATTIWAVRPEMVRLAMGSVFPDQVVSIRDEMPGADYIVTCMTLMHRLGVTPENIPGADGYLVAA